MLTMLHITSKGQGGRLTCSRRRRRKPCLGRASRRRRKFTKKIRRTNQVHGRGREDEAVRTNSVFREVIHVFYNFILKGKMVVSIICWVHQQYCWVHLAFPTSLFSNHQSPKSPAAEKELLWLGSVGSILTITFNYY